MYDKIPKMLFESTKKCVVFRALRGSSFNLNCISFNECLWVWSTIYIIIHLVYYSKSSTQSNSRCGHMMIAFYSLLGRMIKKSINSQYMKFVYRWANQTLDLNFTLKKKFHCKCFSLSNRLGNAYTENSSIEATIWICEKKINTEKK